MKIVIGSCNYKLSLNTADYIQKKFKSFLKEDDITSGIISPLDATIHISNNFPLQTRVQTFLHECIHGMFDELGQSGLYCDEDLVDSLAKQLYIFLKKNDLNKIEKFLGEK